MQKNWIVAVALAGALGMPVAARAQEGHKVMGTVSSIDGKNLMVRTTDGKTVMVMLDAKTKITRGKSSVNLSAVKVGDRLVAEGKDDKGMLSAATVKLGEAPAAKK